MKELEASLNKLTTRVDALEKADLQKQIDALSENLKLKVDWSRYEEDLATIKSLMGDKASP